MATRKAPKHVVRRSRRGKVVWMSVIAAIVVISGVGIAVFAGRSDEHTEERSSAASRPAERVDGLALPIVDVYKTPTCGCCSEWVEHLRGHGFTVRTTDMEDLAALKAGHHVPRHVQSCHTALVDGYVVEGHVPAAEVRRLLTERPAIAGIAVAGMPIGSPGMEVPGADVHPYEVVAFDKSGSTRMFARYP